MDKKKGTWGGKRDGAGRKPIPPGIRKIPANVKLPEWIIDWMDSQKGFSRPALIEEAMVEYYGIKRDEDGG